MNIRHFLTVLSGSAMVLVGTAAEAQMGRGGDRGSRTVSMKLLAADANQDRMITRAEVDALQAEMFDWMDRNSDGYLDEADQSPLRRRLRAYHKDRLAEEGQTRSRRHHRRDGSRGHSDEHSRMRAADTNGDERLSREEFLAMDQPAFDRLDVDQNGVITPQELDAALERRQNRGRWWRD